MSNIQRTNPADKAQEFMHSKKQNVKRSQKQGSPDGSKVPTSGGRQPRPQGEPGMAYAGGTPGFYDKGGPGAPGKVFEGGELPQVGYPGGGNGARPQPTPGPGGRPGPGIPRGEVGGGENTIGRPQPPQFGGGSRPQPPGGRPAPGRGGRPQPPQFGGGQPPQFGGGMGIPQFGGQQQNDQNYIR